MGGSWEVVPGIQGVASEQEAEQRGSRALKRVKSQGHRMGPD